MLLPIDDKLELQSPTDHSLNEQEPLTTMKLDKRLALGIRVINL
jgi:hypothetical protein